MIKFARAVAAVVLVLGGVDALTAAAAEAASGPAGTYVALSTPSRIVNAKKLAAGHVLTVKVAGAGHVPASGAGAVLVTLTASSATAGGGLVAYGAHRPATTNLQFARSSASADTALVPLSRGRIHLRNTARRGSVAISVDVAGYYRAGTPSRSNPGIAHVLPTARNVTTVRVGAHASARVSLGGHAGLPAEPGAAAVTLTVSGATRSGAVLTHRPDEPQQNLPVLRFAAGRPVSSLAVVRLSGGRTTLVNTASRTIHVRVDVAAWYVIGFAQTAGAFQTLVPTRVFSATVRAGRSATVTVRGRGGVPRGGVSAVLAVVHALSPAKSGAVQAWRSGSGRPRRATVTSFSAGRSVSDEALIPVSSGGRIVLRNASKGKVTLALDVHGYVPGTTLTPPAVSRGRYLSDLTGNSMTDSNTMSHDGCVDGKTGSSFVLIDVGAQSVTGRLAGNPGVSVTKTATTVRYSYDELRSLILTYLQQFSSCSSGGAAEIAVGTNNEGDWDPTSSTYYAPTARGTDWATFIAGLNGVAPPKLHVVGANDIEPGFEFGSTQAQAIAWKKAYVANPNVQFVFNGAADGCPVTWTTHGTCAKGWTASGLYGLASGTRTRALPQVYFGAMATQWAMIDATGGGHISFVGSLQQPTVTGVLSAAQSWTALSRALSAIGRTLPRRVVGLIG